MLGLFSIKSVMQDSAGITVFITITGKAKGRDSSLPFTFSGYF